MQEYNNTKEILECEDVNYIQRSVLMRINESILLTIVCEVSIGKFKTFRYTRYNLCISENQNACQ